MSIAKLTVDLEANTEQFERDLERCVALVQRLRKELDDIPPEVFRPLAEAIADALGKTEITVNVAGPLVTR